MVCNLVGENHGFTYLNLKKEVHIMPATVADIIAAVTATIDGIIPLATVGLLAFFGFVVTAGAMLVRRLVKALR